MGEQTNTINNLVGLTILIIVIMVVVARHPLLCTLLEKSSPWTASWELSTPYMTMQMNSLAVIWTFFFFLWVSSLARSAHKDLNRPHCLTCHQSPFSVEHLRELVHPTVQGPRGKDMDDFSGPGLKAWPQGISSYYSLDLSFEEIKCRELASVGV